MWRALVSLALLAIAAVGAVWLAEQPGDVLITWRGYEYGVSVAVAATLVVGFAVALALLILAFRFLVRLPNRMNFASRARRRAKGYSAVSRGMVAVGAGDPVAARRYAREAERLLGREPLTLLLKAQAAQVSGDRNAAEGSFRRMLDNDETRVLGLRGLFVEARRRGDGAAARDYATEAARLAPAVTWANDAVLEAHCAEGDWRGALATVERRASLGLIDKATAKRHRAVLLTADALASAEHDESGALASAQEAVKLAPDLVPAATLAGRLLSRRADLRRAARIVETAWKATPHPDLAAVYLNLRPGDAAKDRLRRAETLAKLSMWSPDARLALARTAIEAREFAQARMALQPLLAERPTMRACLLMADLEQAEHGATGRVREWLARAAHAPRDAAWVADGIVSDRWAPLSPITGKLDAFRWEVPPEALAPPTRALDDVLADLDDKPAVPAPLIAAAAEPIEAASAAAEAREVIEATTPEPATADVAPPAPAEATRPAEPVRIADATGPAEPARPGEAAALQAAETAERAEPAPVIETQPPPAKPNGSGAPYGEPAPVVFPVPHAPDDPGADEAETKRSRFRILG
jgi:HemY protein